jgi:hypothetical protein
MNEIDQWATGQVSAWIVNDEEFCEEARQWARLDREGGTGYLPRFLLGLLDWQPTEAARYLRTRLTEVELAQVSWVAVADDLLGE